jgi:hypothetical protein
MKLFFWVGVVFRFLIVSGSALISFEAWALYRMVEVKWVVN